VTRTTAITTATLKPGISRPNRDWGDKNAGTTLSSVLTARPKTQTVMTNGTQMSKPVMKYFLKDRMMRVGFK
jgi:hypothetical protein